jgi:hypothetical protein
MKIRTPYSPLALFAWQRDDALAGIAYSEHEGDDDRGAWVKTKCLNRAEFVVVGWSDPEGSRPYVGALCLVTSSQMDGWFTQAASARA